VAVAVVGTGLAALHFSRWMIPYLTVMAVAAPALILLLWLDAARSAGWGRGRPRHAAGNLRGPSRPRRTE
jgi:hypothetical protein